MKKCFIFFSDCDLPFTVAFVTNTAAEDGSAIAQRGKYHTFVFKRSLSEAAERFKKRLLMMMMMIIMLLIVIILNVLLMSLNESP